jgi:hypothetical protein
MEECWSMTFDPNGKPHYFHVTICGPYEGSIHATTTYRGGGISISHAAKNAFKKRQNALKLSTKGSTLPSENQTEGNEQAEDSVQTPV